MDGLLTSGEFYSVLCAVIWAAAVVMFKASGLSTPPLALNLYKNSFAFILFVPTMLLAGVALLPPENDTHDALVLLGSGALGIGLADSLFFASLNRLGAGRSAVVDTLYSPLVALCAFLYLAEPVGPGLVLAMGLMTGAILLVAWGGDPDDTVLAPADLRLGMIYGILAMAGMAAGIVWAKPVLERAPVLWSTTVRLGGGLAFLLLFLGHGPSRRAFRAAFTPGRHWRVMVPAAVVGTYMAMVVWIAGMKYAGTTVAAVLNQTSVLLVPVFAAVFLGERLTQRKVAALLLGFAGAALAVL